jgi:hypothetical protein
VCDFCAKKIVLTLGLRKFGISKTKQVEFLNKNRLSFWEKIDAVEIAQNQQTVILN